MREKDRVSRHTHPPSEIIETEGDVLLDGIIRDIYDAGHVTWEWLADAVQTAVTDAAAWIGTVIETILIAGGVAWDALATALQTTITNAGAWIGTIIDDIKTAGEVAWAQLNATAEQVITLLGGVLNNIFDQGAVLYSYLTITWQNITGTIASWANMITGLGSLVWASLTVTWQNILNTISSWANMITGLGSLTWALITKTAANILATLGSITTTQIGTLLTSWANMLTGLGNLIWANLTVTWQNILDTISSWTNMLTGLGNFTWSLITVTWQNIMTTISSWANIISSLGNLAWGYVTHTAANILDTIGSWANIVSEFGNLAWAQVAHTASNILSTLGAISAAAIQGLLTSWEQLTGGSALGDITAAGGDVILDDYGITFIGETIRFKDTLHYGYITADHSAGYLKIRGAYDLMIDFYNGLIKLRGDVQMFGDHDWLPQTTGQGTIGSTAKKFGEIHAYKLFGSPYFDSTPSSDHSAEGIILPGVAGENLVFGNMVYQDGGKYYKSDADSAATMPIIAMATNTIFADATGDFLFLGVVRDDTWNWTVDVLLYAGINPGVLQPNTPSGTGDQIQVVAQAKTADVIIFKPCLAMVEYVV